jgi:hypothetical protein
MHRAESYARAADGLAVWFPSPSEYDAKAFLAAISEVTAQRYIDLYLQLRGTGSQSELRRQRWTGIVTMLAILLPSYAMMVVGVLSATHTDIPRNLWVAVFINPFVVIGCFGCLLSLLAQFLMLRFTRPKSIAEQLYNRANEVKLQARFTAAQKESGEVSAGVSGRGLTAALKRAREVSLTERPSTLSSLVHDYRDLVARISEYLEGPVVVAIDELDKMSSPDDVAKLLRDVKGIFDVAGVHYFVSISDEAARALSLGPLTERNEFNSSFYQVFHLPSLSPADCAALLELRKVHFSETVAASLAVLSGGIPREVVRLADVSLVQPAQLAGARVAAAAVIQREMRDLQRDIERMSTLLSLNETDQVRVYRLERILKSGVELKPEDLLADEMWNPTDASPGWQASVMQQWRRLLVRVAVVSFITEDLEDLEASRLQAIIERSETSALLARLLLFSYMGREAAADGHKPTKHFAWALWRLRSSRRHRQ